MHKATRKDAPGWAQTPNGQAPAAAAAAAQRAPLRRRRKPKIAPAREPRAPPPSPATLTSSVSAGRVGHLVPDGSPKGKVWVWGPVADEGFSSRDATRAAEICRDTGQDCTVDPGCAFLLGIGAGAGRLFEYDPDSDYLGGITTGDGIFVVQDFEADVNLIQNSPCIAAITHDGNEFSLLVDGTLVRMDDGSTHRSWACRLPSSEIGAAIGRVIGLARLEGLEGTFDGEIQFPAAQASLRGPYPNSGNCIAALLALKYGGLTPAAEQLLSFITLPGESCPKLRLVDRRWQPSDELADPDDQPAEEMPIMSLLLDLYDAVAGTPKAREMILVANHPLLLDPSLFLLPHVMPHPGLVRVASLPECGHPSADLFLSELESLHDTELAVRAARSGVFPVLAEILPSTAKEVLLAGVPPAMRSAVWVRFCLTGRMETSPSGSSVVDKIGQRRVAQRCKAVGADSEIVVVNKNPPTLVVTVRLQVRGQMAVHTATVTGDTLTHAGFSASAAIDAFLDVALT